MRRLTLLTSLPRTPARHRVGGWRNTVLKQKTKHIHHVVTLEEKQ